MWPVVLAATAVPWLRSRLTAKTKAEVRIEDAGRRAQPAASTESGAVVSERQSESLPRSIVVELVARFPVVRPGWPARRQVNLSDTIVAPELEDYQTMARRLQAPALIKELSDWQTWLGAQALSIPLVIDPALAYLPWEAMLTLALPAAKDSAWRETLQFWRSGGAPVLRVPVESRWQQGAVLAVCAPNWRLMVEKGWSALRPLVIPTANVETALASTTIKLLHLVGTTIGTGADLRFLVPDRPAGSHEQSAAEEPAALRRGTLLASNALPLASTPIIVLQAEPARLTRRLHADRQQMSMLRRYAAEAFSAGAQAIILLPALPRDLGEAILQIMAKHLGGTPPDVPRLLQALTVMRQTIVGWRAPASDAAPDHVDTAMLESEAVVHQPDLRDSQMELAMDVCLYARSA